MRRMVVAAARMAKVFMNIPINRPKNIFGRSLKTFIRNKIPMTSAFKIIKDRFLYTMAMEAARTIQEGVVTDIREADVGAIIGFGFAPYTGGPLSFIDGMGAAAFVARAKQLAKKYGSHFKPIKLLNEMAKNGETFYERFDPSAASDKEAA